VPGFTWDEAPKLARSSPLTAYELLRQISEKLEAVERKLDAALAQLSGRSGRSAQTTHE